MRHNTSEYDKAYYTANKDKLLASYKARSRTKRGHLDKLYANMRARFENRIPNRVYKIASLLDKSVFFEWALASPEFHELYEAWVSSGYKRQLAPSVDRTNNAGDYQLENMQWMTAEQNALKRHVDAGHKITHGENSRKAALRRHRGVTV